MKLLGITFLLAASMLLAACGNNSSNSSNANVNGNWNASLTPNQGNNPALAFSTTLTTHSDNSVTGTNLKLSTDDGCFSNGATETGSFTLSGNFNGSVNGGFGLTIQGPATGASGNNTLNLQGTVANGNTITGTWNLTGLQSGCTGSGNFTMNKV